MEILTKAGIYSYTPVDLYYGRKLIDKVQSAENLALFKRVLENHGIFFGLIYGTLLGAVREGDFISYDEDVDVFMLDTDREELLGLLFQFRDNGFEVARYDNDLLSLIRGDDYIDIYFFKKKMFGWHCNGDRLPFKFFRKFERLKFLGDSYFTLNNPLMFLEYAYGVNWKTPVRNKPAEVKSLLTTFRALLKTILPKPVIKVIKVILGKT